MVTPSDFFLTEPEFDGLTVTGVDYLDKQYIAADGPATVVNGLIVIIVDTSGGPVVLEMPDPLTAPLKYSPLVFNDGTGAVTITATVNGVVDPQILTQYAAMDINIQSGQYVTSAKVTP